MTKQSGLGDNFYVGGYDLSGDVGSLSGVSSPAGTLDFTGIDKFANERKYGIRDGSMSFNSFFNPTAGQAHPVLSALPTTDAVATYARGTTLGNPAACLVGKQVSYDPTRADDGALTLATQVQANGYGVEWGLQLTAGKRTDTAATNGTSIDTVASASFGGQAYLQVFAFSGTDVTIKIQDSANNSAWTDVTSFAFTQITSGTPQAQRLQLGLTATLRRYLRAITVTTGGVTSVTFSVVVVKNAAAVTF